MLLYPVYALLFADAGLSVAEISSLFAIWSIASFALEIPAGVLADATSRRVLLVMAPLLTASGFALWVFAPSYPAFALGFALWGAQGALRSGALEALVYEELAHVDAAARYPALMGRAAALGTLASALATGIAAPVLAAEGFTGVGVASIAAALAAAAVAATLPEQRAEAAGEARDEDARLPSVLRTGIAIVAAQPSVRAAVLLVAGVTAIWGSLDEYLPLLAVEAGAALPTVPWLVLMVYGGMVIGGLAATGVSRLSSPRLAGLLLISAGALAAGALARAPAGFALIAIAFGGFQALTVSADARLQATIRGPARATITSLAGFATELIVLGVFATYAAGSAVADHATLFALLAASYLLVAAWLRRSHAPPAHRADAR